MEWFSRIRFCFSRHKDRFTPGYDSILFSFYNCYGLATFNHGFSLKSMGDIPLLRAAPEGDFARAPKETYYFRSLSLFKKPALSWWECIYLFRSGVIFWIANRTFSYCHQYLAGGSMDDTARGKTIGALFGEEWVHLQESGPSLALTPKRKIQKPGRNLLIIIWQELASNDFWRHHGR